MDSAQVAKAASAAVGVAVSHGLPATGADVLQSSNKLTLRLTPGSVLARVTRADQQAEQAVELERAQRFAAAGCPVGVVEPSVDPRVYVRDGFAVTLWVYYELASPEVAPAAYAVALRDLHVGLRSAGLDSPRFTDRIVEALQVADEPAVSPELADVDRALLGSTLRRLHRSIEARGAAEQLLHGEPHPGNLLATRSGPLFIDFETTCYGPVELDLAHAPEVVGEHYPEVDPELLQECRELVLAMVAAWRWRLGDEFPDRRWWGRQLLQSLRAGPPWPSPDALTPGVDRLRDEAREPLPRS